MMTANDEIQGVLERMLKRLVAEYKPKKVLLFGSYAYGTPDPDSDVDLLIIKETPERFLDRLVAVRRIISDSRRVVPLEILVLTLEEVSRRLAVGDQFIAEIVDKGKVLYAT
jgi:uncharacterized protein